MRDNNFKVSVVLPVFNELGCVQSVTERVVKLLKEYNDYEILFIDDGSIDGSLEEIKNLKNDNQKIQFISFSRNFGHQNALRAGLRYSSGDCVISLDSDLQHPPELIPQMIGRWLEGFDVVYTIRRDMNKGPSLKKLTGRLFYRIMNLFSDLEFDEGEADFRLLDRTVVDEINNLSEEGIFLRGMIKWFGFHQTGIEYEPDERIWGATKYSRKKMMGLALSGITGFSVKPLRISTIIGVTTAIMSLVYGLYALYIKLFTDRSVEGWASLFFMVTFLGGIQLIMIGILGEYLGKIFLSSKRRPQYIVKEASIKENR
jgi:dolichol-phosphate mannosyltransferase